MVRREHHVAVTSEFDVAIEVATGELVFVPIEDVSAAAQTISLIVSSARVMPTVSQLVSDILIQCAEAALEDARQVITD